MQCKSNIILVIDILHFMALIKLYSSMNGAENVPSEQNVEWLISLATSP